jgi:hypothetical protein
VVPTTLDHTVVNFSPELHKDVNTSLKRMKTRTKDYSKLFTISAAEAAKALLELKKACQVQPSVKRPQRSIKKVNYAE